MKIISNTALSSGALFITGYSSPKISNVLLANNKTYVNGGSITVEEYSNPVFTNVTISDNGYPDKVHPMIIQYFGEMNPTMVNGIHISNGSNVFIKSSIIYSEADLEVLFGEYGEGSSLTISYSNLDGGKSSIIDKYNSGTLNWNEGNIVADPKFVNPKKNNYSLQNRLRLLSSEHLAFLSDLTGLEIVLHMGYHYSYLQLLIAQQRVV